MLPKDVSIQNDSLLAKITRSSTIGSDRDLTFCLVVVDAASYVQEPTWLVAGWDPVCRAAPNERDYLLPSPTNDCNGCMSTELSYGFAFTFQSRVITFLTLRGRRPCNFRVGHHWTPHSGRNFMLSRSRTFTIRPRPARRLESRRQ